VRGVVADQILGSKLLAGQVSEFVHLEVVGLKLGFIPCVMGLDISQVFEPDCQSVSYFFFRVFFVESDLPKFKFHVAWVVGSGLHAVESDSSDGQSC